MLECLDYANDMKYNILIFDADDTLFDFQKSERVAIQNTMLEFEFNYDENYHLNIYHDINLAIWKELEQGLITQEKLKVERFRRLSDKLNVSFDANEFAKSYMNHLSNASFLIDGSKELIKNLNMKYTLELITNGLTEVQDKRVRQSELAKYFDSIIISEEVKAAKPDPKIFEFALKNIKNLDKSKILMIGDGLTSDIQGGINFGIDTCWYNPKKLENKTEIKPNYEIYHWNHLNEILQET